MAKSANMNLRKSAIKTEHKLLLDQIRDSYDYFRPNYDRYVFFMNFVFRSSMSTDEINLLKETSKPQIEFNILEAFLSRLRGEFARNEPTLVVQPMPGAKNPNPMLVNVLEGYMRSIMIDSNVDNTQWDIFTQALGGGFSAFKVWTDYLHEMTFDQGIYFGNVFDPTLIGFDKLARKSHKGDGKFCFEIFPMNRDEFEEKYGTEWTKDMKFIRSLEGFNWSYSAGNQDIVVLGNHYAKKVSKGKIVRLVDGTTMKDEDYQKKLENWDKFYQPPAPVGKPRQTEFVHIVRKTVVETGTLDTEDTDFKNFPLVFVDGNSVMLRQTVNGAAAQLTRPYVYHAKGIQKLKNFSGITLANELENLVMHKFMAAKEAVPEGFTDSYSDVQKPDVLLWNAFLDKDGKIPLPKPEVIPRQPAPPEIAQTFTMSDDVTKAILGNYDNAIGNSDSQTSGVAIENGTINSNASSMPFITNYMRALNQVGTIILNLVPKYIIEPREIPVRDIRGKSSYVVVNDSENPNSVSMDFADNSYEIRIKAGVSFEIQQKRAYQMLINLIQVSPVMAQFIMQEEGIETLLDNLDIRGIDALKAGVSKFVEKAEKERDMAKQAQMQPLMLKQAELQQRAKEKETEATLEAAKINVSQEEADTERMLAMAKIGEMTDKNDLMRDKIQAQNARTAVDAATKVADTAHSHAMDILGLHHQKEIAQSSTIGE